MGKVQRCLFESGGSKQRPVDPKKKNPFVFGSLCKKKGDLDMKKTTEINLNEVDGGIKIGRSEFLYSEDSPQRNIAGRTITISNESGGVLIILTGNDVSVKNEKGEVIA